MTEQLARLERLLDEAAQDKVSLAEFVDAFLASPVLLPSSTNPVEGIRPLVVGTQAESYDSAVVFTSGSRVPEFRSLVPFVAGLTGAQVVRGLKRGLGLVVNPGSSAGVRFDPDAVAEMRDRA